MKIFAVRYYHCHSVTPAGPCRGAAACVCATGVAVLRRMRRRRSGAARPVVQQTQERALRVVIVGGGVGGLSAASALIKGTRGNGDSKPLEVVVLEGRDRLGGRVHTVTLGKSRLSVSSVWPHRRREGCVTVGRAGGRPTFSLHGPVIVDRAQTACRTQCGCTSVLRHATACRSRSAAARASAFRF